MNRIVLITGATSGFGKAMAEKYAALGDKLIITGRRKERLEALKQSLSAQTAIIDLCFDIRSREACDKAIASLPESWQQIDILINNAGLAAGRDSFAEASLDDWDNMIDTNVKGVMYITKAVVPFMMARKQGHIVNIGSIAGKEVYPMGNGYNASKFAMDALSKSMRIDLLPFNIRVTLIAPGAVETEFSLVRFKGDAQKAAAVYEGYKALSAGDIADIAVYVTGLPAHVCINDLVVTPTAQANSFTIHREGK